MPQAAAGEVVRRIEAVGICGSDMHAWHSHDPRRQPGLVLGHEFVGTIAQSAAPGFEVGTRFTGNPLIVCGTCEYCRTEGEPLCLSYGLLGEHHPGTLAEYVVVPAGNLARVPEGIDLSEAAAFPLATLTSRAEGRISASSAAPIMPRVSAVSGTASTTMSARGRSCPSAAGS